jgi:hypothetical protein
MFYSDLVYSQNWRSISLTDTNHFQVLAPLNNGDSIWNGYLRSIHTVSSSYSGNYHILDLPTSTRKNMFGVVQQSNGDSWLGSKVIIDTLNGVETFFNQLGDSIFINTWASVNDTWPMGKDTNGIIIYATVISADTLTIDGILDSIKTISLQAFLNANPVSNYYNNQDIKISKEHGFLNTFEFYGFPNYNMNYSFDWLSNPDVPYPILFYPHARLDKKITQINTNKPDLATKFLPGNEWIIYTKNNGGPNNLSILHDSIISSNMLTSTEIEVTHYKHIFVTQYLTNATPPHDTIYHSYSTGTDTIDISNLQEQRIQNKIYEQAQSMTNPNKFEWSFLFILFAK